MTRTRKQLTTSGARRDRQQYCCGRDAQDYRGFHADE